MTNIWQERRPQTREVRWHYTVTLRETAGRLVKFEEERTTTEVGGRRIGDPRVAPFVRDLQPNGSLTAVVWQSVIYLTPGAMDPPVQKTPVFWRRLTGRDEDGRPIIVDIRFTP